MPTREEWAIIGLILGAVAVVGIAVWVLRKKTSPQRIQLRKVGESKVVLRNLERRKVIRDREGNIQEIIIEREVKA